MIPLLLFMGGAVDIARYNRYKVALSNAVDSAALALARNIDDYNDTCPAPEEGDPPVLCEAASEDIAAMIAAFEVADSGFSVEAADLQAERTSGGFLVTAQGQMDTIFLPLGNLSDVGTRMVTMDVGVLSEAMQATNRVELALVFDNTGSMSDNAGANACGVGSDRMAGLKCAATMLVDELMPVNTGTVPDMLKIAVVPFEGAVNVASTGFDTANPPAWIDWADQAQAKYTGRNMNPKDFGGSIGVQRVGHKWLYEKLGVAWVGCVEMRAEPYDLLDTVPSAANPDTLFVPMFWPDEPDTSTSYFNNYLSDGVASGTSNGDRQLSLVKYDVAAPSSISWRSPASTYNDTTFTYQYGPNRGCPRPITPLTNDEATIDAAIAAMQPHAATGTFIPVGLIWGWHVLSSSEPYTQGLAPDAEEFEDTIKAIVLLTDGANSPTGLSSSSSNHNRSTYSGYNYLATKVDDQSRLQWPGTTSTPSNTTATAVLDDKTADLCDNVKDAGIRLYTITFGSMSSAATTLMENCASVDDGDSLYFHAPDASGLDDIFREIGEDLTEIHLSR
jgi:hypothetical protein